VIVLGVGAAGSCSLGPNSASRHPIGCRECEKSALNSGRFSRNPWMHRNLRSQRGDPGAWGDWTDRTHRVWAFGQCRLAHGPDYHKHRPSALALGSPDRRRLPGTPVAGSLPGPARGSPPSQSRDAGPPRAPLPVTVRRSPLCGVLPEESAGRGRRTSQLGPGVRGRSTLWPLTRTSERVAVRVLREVHARFVGGDQARAPA
jgi:hypothetical protein